MRIAILLLGACTTYTPPGTPADCVGHDEDGDGIPDACDNCPGVSNLGQDDTVELMDDGVGDACDPDTQRTNLVAFDPMTTSNGWTREAGSWVDGDDSVASNPAMSELALLSHNGAPLVPPLAIQIQFTVVGGFTTGSVAGVVFDTFGTQRGELGVACQLDRTATGDAVTAVFKDGMGGSESQSQPVVPGETIRAGDVDLMQVNYDGQSIRCQVGTTVTALTLSSPAFPGPLLLFTNTTVAIDYVTLYEVR